MNIQYFLQTPLYSYIHFLLHSSDRLLKIFILFLYILLFSACAPKNLSTSSPSPINAPTDPQSLLPSQIPITPASVITSTSTITPTSDRLHLVTLKEITLPDLNPVWTSYTNSNTIQSMVIDREGNIWAGGIGLVKWNVTEGSYSKYTVDQGLGDNVVESITLAPDGSLWVASHTGFLSHKIGEDWNTIVSPLEKTTYGFVYSIAVTHDSYVWLGTSDGLYSYDGQEWQVRREIENIQNGDIYSLAVAADGSLWGCAGRSIFQYDVSNRTWTSYSNLDGMADEYISSLSLGQNGTVFVNHGTKISYYDGENWKILGNELMLGEDIIYDAMVSIGNVIWFNTKSGLFQYEIDGSLTSIPRPTELMGISINSIEIDADGTVWLGTGAGLFSFDRSYWSAYYTNDEFISNEIFSSTMTPSGTLLFGTKSGLIAYDEHGWINYPPVSNGDISFVYALHADKNNSIWVGTGGNGAFHFDGEEWTSYTQESTDFGLPGNDISTIATTLDNSVWFGTKKFGLFRFDGNTWQDYSLLDGISSFVSDIAVATDGTMWVATGEGVLKYDGETWTHYRKVGGLAEDDIRCITIAPDGLIWVGMPNFGIAHFTGDTWLGYRFPQDYQQIWVTDIEVTPDGKVWIGTDEGLYRFDEDDGWKLFTTEDGLGSNFVSTILISVDGSLWIGTAGISHFIP